MNPRRMLKPDALNTLLDPQESYTFRDYFENPLDARDIARGFGWTVIEDSAQLLAANVPDLSHLQRSLEIGMKRARLVNEMARREAIIAPTLLEICDIADLKLDTEYAIAVSPHLKGNVDYQIKAQATLVVIEAKQSDLAGGFKQLVAELIAMHYWAEEPSTALSGCVTDGERWQFVTTDRSHATIRQHQKLYSINDLNETVGTLLALLN